MSEQGVSGKIHLRDESGCDIIAKQGKVNVIRSPCIRMVPPWIGAWFNGVKFIVALFIRQASSTAEKIWVQWRHVLIDVMDITDSGICLPYFDEGVFNRMPAFVGNLTGHNNALTNRVSVDDPVPGQVVVEFANYFLSKYWRSKQSKGIMD